MPKFVWTPRQSSKQGPGGAEAEFTQLFDWSLQYSYMALCRHIIHKLGSFSGVYRRNNTDSTVTAVALNYEDGIYRHEADHKHK